MYGFFIAVLIFLGAIWFVAERNQKERTNDLLLQICLNTAASTEQENMCRNQ